MAKDDVLDRVDRDLRRGHVHPAMQRLASLVAADPTDLSVRARRAAVNRQIGNMVEAGRWGFLTEEVSAAEVRAFERAHPRPAARLSALRLAGHPVPDLGETAARRYADLVRAAGTGAIDGAEVAPAAKRRVEAERGVGAASGFEGTIEGTPMRGRPSPRVLLLLVGPFVLGAALLAFAIVGVVTVVRAIF